MGEYVKILTALVAALGGWEFIKYMLNRKSNGKIAEANAFKVEREALIEDYERVQEEVAALKKKVDELYDKVHKLEDERLGLINENNELRLALKEAEKKICLQPDDKCLRRLNDGVKCRLVDLLRGEYTKDHAGAILTDDDMKKKDEKDNGISEKPDKG